MSSKENLLYWSPLFSSDHLKRFNAVPLTAEKGADFYLKNDFESLSLKLSTSPETTVIIDLWPIFFQNTSLSQWIWSFLNHAAKKHRYIFLCPQPHPFKTHLSQETHEIYSVYSLLVNSKLDFMCLLSNPPMEHIKNIVSFSFAEFNRSTWIHFAPWSFLKKKEFNVSSTKEIDSFLLNEFKTGFFLLETQQFAAVPLPTSGKVTFPCMFKDFFPRKINAKKIKAYF